MKCNNCGFENEKGFEYCVNCGQPSKPQGTKEVEPVSLNPAADIVLPALQDKLFLALCILMTVSCTLSMLASGMPLINILITMFLWLTYFDAKKGFANEKHLQSISGTVYANYVIVQVCGIILLVCGALSLFVGIMMVFNGEGFDMLGEILQELDKTEFNAEFIAILETFGAFSIVIVAATLVLVGVIVLVFNILMMRKIHRFAKSIYQGIMYQNPNFEKPTAVRNWFIFIAVCNGINVISSITSADPIYILTSVCSMAISIVVISLLNKHIV